MESMPSSKPAAKGASKERDSQKRVRVLIADSQLMFAQGLAAALEWAPDLKIVNIYPQSGPDAVSAIEHWKPDVAIVDFWMVEMEGPAVARTVAGKVPGCRVILLSWLYDRRDVAFGLEAGAAGFLPKSLSTDHVLHAVRRVYDGDFPVLPAELKKLITDAEKQASQKGQILARMATLTPRELETLILLSYGGGVAEVAQQLNVSPKTLKKHISHILAKSGARSHTQAVAMARFCGLIQT